MGYRPLGHKESDTTERIHFLFFLWGGSLRKGPVVQAHSSRGLTGG